MKNCIRCGNEIPTERLEAMPETEICVGCSRDIGGEFILLVGYENCSKTGSMKRTYGGVKVTKLRKIIRPLSAGEI